MALTNKLTGKAIVFRIAGTTIGVTKTKPKFTRNLVDVTDSTSYDSSSDLVWKEQLVNSMEGEFSIEGNYNVVTTPAAIITWLLTGGAPQTCSLTLSSGYVLGHGLFDISDFEADAPVEDKVTFTATLKLNGIFTAGS